MRTSASPRPHSLRHETAADKLRATTARKYPRCCNRVRPRSRRKPHNALRMRLRCRDQPCSCPEIPGFLRRQSSSRDKDLPPRLPQSVPSADRAQCPPWARTPTSHLKRLLPWRRPARPVQSIADQNFPRSPAAPEKPCDIRESRHSPESTESSVSTAQPRPAALHWPAPPPTLPAATRPRPA